MSCPPATRVAGVWRRIDHCRDRGILIQAYSPLTRTDRVDDELTDVQVRRLQERNERCYALGGSLHYT